MHVPLKNLTKEYNSYVSNLPLPQEIISILTDSKSIDKNPQFYLQYASLFENNFKFENSTNKISQLNIAGYLCYKYALLMDNLLDKESKTNTLALSNICLEETIKILTNLFGLENTFWKLWNSRKKEFYDASRIGKSMFDKKEIDTNDFENLCDLKSALGKIAIDSLYVLGDCKNTEAYNKLIESHKFFSIGFQINDDIEDFIEDYHSKDFNYALYCFLKNDNLTHENINDLNKLFYISGTAKELYRLSLSYFKKSLAIAEEVDEPKWVEAITGKINETESAIFAINEYLTLIQTRSTLKENSQKINSFDYSFNKDSIIEKGISYLVKEWEINLPEIKHIMVLSNREGFNNNTTVHITDIFQRGILANNLIDIQNNYSIELNKIINHEINYLIDNRNKDKTGGWSYFPTVKEIAADADDLGQMMQVFIKGNKSNLTDQFCLPAIQILLTDCYDSKSGGIETWIIPKNNRSEIQKIQNEFNSTKWGSGPDIDVMANFLYALSLKDYNHYKIFLEKGLKYIYQYINKDHSWNSRWYYGWLYGTMICIRLTKELIKLNPKLANDYNEMISKVHFNILQNQKVDGGWGIDSNSNSDPLNTSFALLTLGMIDQGKANKKHIETGIDFLNATQNKDGSWAAIPFIKPRLNEPYKSKTITTSYVLNALTLINGRSAF